MAASRRQAPPSAGALDIKYELAAIAYALIRPSPRYSAEAQRIESDVQRHLEELLGSRAVDARFKVAGAAENYIMHRLGVAGSTSAMRRLPRIAIRSGLTEEQLAFTIAHERFHAQQQIANPLPVIERNLSNRRLGFNRFLIEEGSADLYAAAYVTRGSSQDPRAILQRLFGPSNPVVVADRMQRLYDQIRDSDSLSPRRLFSRAMTSEEILMMRKGYTLADYFMALLYASNGLDISRTLEEVLRQNTFYLTRQAIWRTRHDKDGSMRDALLGALRPPEEQTSR